MSEAPVPEKCTEEQMQDRGQTHASLERSPAVQNLRARNGDINGIQKLFQTPGFLPGVCITRLRPTISALRKNISCRGLGY